MNKQRTEQEIERRGERILMAARTLIGLVRMSEKMEGERSTGAELSLDLELTGGGTETWKITIERTAPSH